MRTPVAVAVVGLDRWALRVARSLSELPRSELRWLCDDPRGAGLRGGLRPPPAPRTTRFADLLEDEMVDAVVVSAPAAGRPKLVKQALEAGKHVLTRSPLALSGSEADELASLAARLNLRVVAAHERVFDPAAERLKELVELGRLGDLFYAYTSRHTNGDLERDALWSGIADDLPLLLHLVADEPVEVWARGDSYLEPDVVDVVVCHLRFATGIGAYLHASCVEPRPVSRLTVVGSARLAVLEDSELERRLVVHERARRSHGTGAAHALVAFDDGDDGPADPIHRLCEHFVSIVRSPAELPLARQAASVVNVLEALARSLELGAPLAVRAAPAAANVVNLPLPPRR